MKALVSILAESPFYFTMPLRDRYGLVKRLMEKEQQRIDLNGYLIKMNAFLKIEELNLPKFLSL